MSVAEGPLFLESLCPGVLASQSPRIGDTTYNPPHQVRAGQHWGSLGHGSVANLNSLLLRQD